MLEWALTRGRRRVGMSHNTMNYAERMRARGYRVTPQRRLILDAICAGGGHTTLEEIQQRVQAKDASISLSTIYRALDFLCELRLVATAEVNGGRMVYEIASEQPHHHLVCRRCGKTVQIDHAEVGAFFDQLEQQHDFAVDSNHLALFGLCGECRNSG